MDEIKRVVVEDYPADKLPQDVRGDIDPSHRVQITVIDTTMPDRAIRWTALMGKLAEYRRNDPGKLVTSEEAVARVRAIRDDWD